MLRDNTLYCGEKFFDESVAIEIVARGEILDVRIGSDTAMVNCLPVREKGQCHLFCECGRIKIERMTATELGPLP